jgi:hypothetical protein
MIQSPMAMENGKPLDSTDGLVSLGPEEKFGQDEPSERALDSAYCYRVRSYLFRRTG